MTRPENDKTSSYIHGTAPTEQRRLSRLNELLNDASLREMKLRGGEKILDVGCGLAQFTRAMARAAGGGARVLGIERDAGQLAEAKRQAEAAQEGELIELREGNALALPLREEEWGTFDIAHARFLLEHLPDIVENLEKILVGARAQIVETAHIDGESFDRAIEALNRWANLPDAAFWFATFWAEGSRPDNV